MVCVCVCVCVDCSSRNGGAQRVGVRAFVVGGEDVSVCGTVVQRLWIVVSRTDSSPLAALFHGAAAPIGPGACRYPGFTII